MPAFSFVLRSATPLRGPFVTPEDSDAPFHAVLARGLSRLPELHGLGTNDHGRGRGRLRAPSLQHHRTWPRRSGSSSKRSAASSRRSARTTSRSSSSRTCSCSSGRCRRRPAARSGRTVNHVGFSVPDLKPVVAKLKANGFKMITSDSVAATVKVTDDIAAASPTTNIAFVLGPEDIKVELVEVKTQQAPIQLHHVHFFGEQPRRDAGVVRETFRRRGAAGQSEPGVRDGHASGCDAELLAVADADRGDAGPRARSHRLRGQEPRGVHEEARSRRDSADRVVPHASTRSNIAIAFIKDPWGTNIELTEGLAGID